MTTFEVSIIINQPNDVVTKALMNAPYWQTGLEKFEVIESKPCEVILVDNVKEDVKNV